MHPSSGWRVIFSKGPAGQATVTKTEISVKKLSGWKENQIKLLYTDHKEVLGLLGLRFNFLGRRRSWTPPSSAANTQGCTINSVMLGHKSHQRTLLQPVSLGWSFRQQHPNRLSSSRSSSSPNKQPFLLLQTVPKLHRLGLHHAHKTDKLGPDPPPPKDKMAHILGILGFCNQMLSAKGTWLCCLGSKKIW